MRIVSRIGSSLVVMALVCSSVLCPTFAVGEPGEQTTGVTDSEINIGTCVPMSGVLQVRAQHLTQGGKAYFDFVNEHGGINGRKIKFIICDDRYDATEAIHCFNTCVKNKVFAGAFFLGAATAPKYSKMGSLSKTPLVGFATGMPAVYEFDPTTFLVRAGYRDEVAKQVNELWDAGFRRFAIAYQSDALGAMARENAVAALKKHGTAAIAEASFSRKPEEIDSAIKRLREADPQVVLLGCNQFPLKGFVSKKDEQNWHVLLCGLSVTSDYLEGLGKAADGVLITQTTPLLDEHIPACANYVKLLKKSDPKAEPSVNGLEGYLIAEVLVEGLKRAGKDLTRDKFVKAMESIQKLDLGLGSRYKVSYSPTNHQGLSLDSISFSVVKDGKLVAVSPNDWKAILKEYKGR